MLARICGMDVDGLIGAQAIEPDDTGTKTVPSARDHAPCPPCDLSDTEIRPNLCLRVLRLID